MALYHFREKIMKVKKNCVVGDPVLLDRYTSDWASIRLHPITFYRRLDVFRKSLKKVKGFYAEIDSGQFVSIRFSEQDDITAFYKTHKEYV